mmetsp:Transcript_9664/g.15865  ORF Transcript_9664/g.15865 Transcript_9664/m.15865 type:complete len:107 (+) Transcript_9664:217-537(+)
MEGKEQQPEEEGKVVENVAEDVDGGEDTTPVTRPEDEETVSRNGKRVVTPATKNVYEEVLPTTGLVFSERGNLTEILCKPKILPLKSATLLRMEKLEKQARENSIN